MLQRNMGLFSAIALGTSLLIGCSDSSSPEYRITKDESMQDIKRTVEVLLPNRIDESELESLAQDIYETGFERTFIGYRIEGDDQGGVYWATTHYNPDLNVTILGSTGDEHEAVISSELEIDGDLVGSWLVNWGYEYKAAIYERQGSTYMVTKFSDGSGQTKELDVQDEHGEIRYYDESGKERGEYYQIGSDGALQFWSSNGNYYTAPKAD
jgi:hypothetical protein